VEHRHVLDPDPARPGVEPQRICPMNKSIAVALFLGFMALINTVLSPDGHLDRIADARGDAPVASAQPHLPAERPTPMTAAVTTRPQASAAPVAHSANEGTSSFWDLFSSDEANEGTATPAGTAGPAARQHRVRQASAHVPRSTTEGELSPAQLHVEE
jgi:hypothetical protein